jgi:hypothetical protein
MCSPPNNFSKFTQFVELSRKYYVKSVFQHRSKLRAQLFNVRTAHIRRSRNDQQYALILPLLYFIYWLLHVSTIACHHQGAS